MKVYQLLAFLLVFSACSSSPRNSGEINDMRRRAETQLDQGNRQADRGSLDFALHLLDEAFRLSVVTDDPGLLVRTGLSRSNVLFSLGRSDEALAGWNGALAEAARTGNRELEAVCRIHLSRGRLLVSGSAVAQTVRDEVSRDLPLISDRQYSAFAWTVIALAERELGRYTEAEAAINRSLEVHMRDRNLELAAFNWFMIASFRSLSGNFSGARGALETAINYDRRVENSWGLANNWRALGDVEKRAGNREASRDAYLRAAAIFQAMDLEDIAEETLARISD